MAFRQLPEELAAEEAFNGPGMRIPFEEFVKALILAKARDAPPPWARGAPLRRGGKCPVLGGNSPTLSPGMQLCDGVAAGYV